MLSNSSTFEKEFNSTHAYDCEEPQFGESAFDFAQTIDEFDLEQSCLMRLKAQREKIEELTKLYQENQKELVLRAEREKKLEEEVERLTQLEEYRISYTELRTEFDAQIKRMQLGDLERDELRKELQALVEASSEQIQQLRQETKLLRQQKGLCDSHWQAILSDKEELIKKHTRAAQEREYELTEQLKAQEEQITALREELSEHKVELEENKQLLQREIRAREEELSNFERVAEGLRRQCSEWRNKVSTLQGEYDQQRGEWQELAEQLRHQLKLSRRDQSEKEGEVYEFKEMLRKCDAKNQSLESTIANLRTSLKKTKVNTDTSLRKLTANSEEEVRRLELFVQELKAEVEHQMQEKAALTSQLKRAKAIVERKEQQQKQRKLLLMSEFREIDKMEKVVKRVI